jgi:hypothetical protein
MSAAFALAVGLALSIPGASLNQAGNQTGPLRGPDLSGRWTQASADLPDGPGKSGWGSQTQIDQSGSNVTVRSASGGTEQYRLDGKETATVVSVKGCANTVRITKTVINRDHVTITTWLVTKSFCVHGEEEDDPRIPSTGPIDPLKVIGRRILESISDVYRDDDALTVATTRSAPGGVPTSTTTVYRK